MQTSPQHQTSCNPLSSNSVPGREAHPAHQLHAIGYTELVSVIPPDGSLAPGTSIRQKDRGKVPGRKYGDGWGGYSWRDTDVALQELEQDGANVGLRGELFPGLDIDVNDPRLVRAVQALAEAILGEAPVRLSRQPRRLLVYRTDEPFGRLSLKIKWEGEWHLVEWLGAGRQYLVHGTHPSGAEYRWDGDPLWEYDPGQLATVSVEQAAAFLDELARLLEARGVETERAGQGTNAADHAPPQEDLKAPSLEVLQDLPLPPNPDEFGWDEFIKHGYAFKAAGQEDETLAYDRWVAWAEQHPDFDPDVCEHEWDKLRPPFRVGFTWLAEQAGVSTAPFEFERIPAEPNPPAPPNPRQEALEELNDSYAVVKYGSGVAIMEEGRGRVEFRSESQFRLWLKNRTVPSESRPWQRESLASAWLVWPDRRQFESVEFLPGVPTPPAGVFNLWRGWNVQPQSAGSCGLFMDHLLHVVCGGDCDLLAWLLDWFAHLFQHPQHKPDTVVALQGGQGAGKSIVGSIMKKLLGPHHVTVDRGRQVTGNFNAHLEQCLLLQAEEAFWAGDKSAESALKHLVTGETLAIERKGFDVVERPNYTRMLITTNNDRVWPTALDDRRLAIFRVSDDRAFDRAYFDAIFRELESGGYERLLHDMLARDIDYDRLRRPPRTLALEAQAAESEGPEQRWLFDLLESGRIVGERTADGGVEVTIAHLYEEYVRSASDGERRYLKSVRAFGFYVQDRLRAKKLNDRKHVLTRAGPSRSRRYQLPPLADLREQYSRGRAATQTWDGPDEWLPRSEWSDFGDTDEAA
jgi:hypothetical protein